MGNLSLIGIPMSHDGAGSVIRTTCEMQLPTSPQHLFAEHPLCDRRRAGLGSKATWACLPSELMV